MISVILPVFKTGPFLEELVNRLHRSLDSAGYPHCIYCVNDCCPQNSLAVLQKIAGRDRRLRAIDLKENVGQHKAVLIGMSFASGDWIAVMDADLQDPPESLPSLIETARKNNAVVFAGRRGIYESLPRLLTSRIFKASLSLLAGVPDDAGMFFIISQKVKKELLNMNGSEPFIPAMLNMVSAPKISIPVKRDKRPLPGSSYSSLQRALIGMRAIKYALQCRLGIPSPKHLDCRSFVRTVAGE